jgi:hypothetical protein
LIQVKVVTEIKLANTSRFSSPARLAQHVVTVALETLLHFRRIGKVRRIRDAGERRDVLSVTWVSAWSFAARSMNWLTPPNIKAPMARRLLRGHRAANALAEDVDPIPI